MDLPPASMVPTSRLDDDTIQRPPKQHDTHIGQTIVARVPDEVLSIVFSRFTLGDVVPFMRVCTRWRAVVLEHHAYSSTLHLPADAPLTRLEFVLRQVTHAAERVNGRYFNIDVNLVACSAHDATRLVRALSGCVSRTVTMKVVANVEAFPMAEEQLMRKAPLLTELEFGVARVGGRAVDVDVAWRGPGRLQAPNLHSLTLIGLLIPPYPGTVLPSIRHLRVERPWVGPVSMVNFRALSHLFPSLATLTLSGNIKVESLSAPSTPPANAVTCPDDLGIALRRLTLDTLDSGTQWPVLQPHLRHTQTLEINSVTQDGVRAILDHLRPPYSMSVFMSTSLGSTGAPVSSMAAHLPTAASVDDDTPYVRFAAHGSCGRTFAVLFGGTNLGDYYSHLPVNAQTHASLGDVPRVDIALLAPQVVKVNMEVDLWDVPCNPNVEYGMLEEMRLVWTSAPTSGEEGSIARWDGRMIMPLGGRGIFSCCPALRVLALENAYGSRAIVKQPWVDAEEVEDFARGSLVGVDFRDVELRLLGLELRRNGVKVMRDTIFGEVSIIPGSV